MYLLNFSIVWLVVAYCIAGTQVLGLVKHDLWFSIVLESRQLLVLISKLF